MLDRQMEEFAEFRVGDRCVLAQPHMFWTNKAGLQAYVLGNMTCEKSRFQNDFQCLNNYANVGRPEAVPIFKIVPQLVPKMSTYAPRFNVWLIVDQAATLKMVTATQKIHFVTENSGKKWAKFIRRRFRYY